jgi:hypothetical protein
MNASKCKCWYSCLVELAHGVVLMQVVSLRQVVLLLSFLWFNELLRHF